jgi:hypothetical protein
VIQFVRYSDNPAVQRAAEIAVNNFGGAFANPKHATAPAVLDELAKRFGDFARDLKIRIH